MPTVSDRNLVARAQGGDKNALAALARKYEGQVYAIAYSRLVNVADAEDVVQETFLQAYRVLRQLRSPERFGGWVARIALSFSSKLLRLRLREPVADVAELLRDVATPVVGQETYERGEDARELIEAALASLPETLRTPFVMRHMVDASYKAIAESLIITPRAAERRVRRARERLQRYFTSRGLRDLARDVLFSGALLSAGDGALESVLESVLGSWMAVPPHPPSAAPSARYVPAVAASALIVCGLFSGVAMRDGRMRASTVNEIARPVVLMRPGGSIISRTGRPAPALRRASLVDIPPGAVAILREDFAQLAPGQPLPGWSRGVHAQTRDTRPGGDAAGGVVSTNIPSAYFRFPRVQGVLTVDVWVKPHPGDAANFGIRIGHGGRETGATDTPIVDASVLLSAEPTSFMPIHKDDTDTWFYRVAGLSVPVPFAEYDGEWHHVRVRYDTHRSEYALYVDGCPCRWTPQAP
jgi:RNA polymerase sigma-70 factor (ECF subfamily)